MYSAAFSTDWQKYAWNISLAYWSVCSIVLGNFSVRIDFSSASTTSQKPLPPSLRFKTSK
jgi:hypothetical protein